MPNARKMLLCTLILPTIPLAVFLGGCTSSTKQAGPREASVGAYLERLKKIPDVERYIESASQPDADYAIVYVEFRRGVPDYQIKELVRSITEGVHKNSSRGTATVTAQVNGITVAQGEYKILSGAIEVKMLR